MINKIYAQNDKSLNCGLVVGKICPATSRFVTGINVLKFMGL